MKYPRLKMIKYCWLPEFQQWIVQRATSLLDEMKFNPENKMPAGSRQYKEKRRRLILMLKCFSWLACQRLPPQLQRSTSPASSLSTHRWISLCSFLLFPKMLHDISLNSRFICNMMLSLLSFWPLSVSPPHSSLFLIHHPSSLYFFCLLWTQPMIFPFSFVFFWPPQKQNY